MTHRADTLLGTVVDIIVLDFDPQHAQSGVEQAFAEIRRIESLMSYYRAHSDVSRINNAPAGQGVCVSEEVFGLLQQAEIISRMTKGAFDITFAPVWQLWNRCADQGRLPLPEEIDDAKALVDFRQVQLSAESLVVKLGVQSMTINLGGIAKGYALDRAGDVLKKAGLTNFLVNIGGDVLAMGDGREGKGWKIGIQHPRRAGELIGALWIKNGSVLTSGDYERYLEIQRMRYHHILDARTGYPSERCLQVTTVGPGLGAHYLPCVTLFLLGPEAGLKLLEGHPETAAAFITHDGKVVATANLTHFLQAPLPSLVDAEQAI